MIRVRHKFGDARPFQEGAVYIKPSEILNCTKSSDEPVSYVVCCRRFFGTSNVMLVVHPDDNWKMEQVIEGTFSAGRHNP